MGRATLELRLAQVTQHVEETAERITQQEAEIVQLDRNRRDTSEARKVLGVLREALEKSQYVCRITNASFVFQTGWQ